MFQEILVNVSFLKHTLTKKDSGVVEGDYNSTKLVFAFEEDIKSNYKVRFKMSNPHGEVVLLEELKDLTKPEIILAGYDDNGDVYSLFPEQGLYPFELVLFDEDSKLTSAPGWLNVSKRQVNVGQGGGVEYYLPMLDELITRVEALEQSGTGGGITIDDVKPFRFTVTQDGKNYRSSATYEEIKEVIDTGNRSVICEYEEYDLPFAGMLGAENFMFYTGASAYDIRITINTYTVNVQQEEIAPVTVVNVLDYGAVGDGVTDDTDAIQEALYVAEEQGLPLYIPAGNYLVSKTITTHARDTEHAKQSKALNIYGDGMNTLFTTTEDFDGEYVFYIDVKGTQPRMLWVHDFAIDLYADVSGIYFHEIGMKSVVENLWITNKCEANTDVRSGIYCVAATVTTFEKIKCMYFGTGAGIAIGVMNSCKVIDCDTIFCRYGIYALGGGNAIVQNCRLDENEYGIYQYFNTDKLLETNAYVKDGENVFKQPLDAMGISTGVFAGLTIQGCRFEHNGDRAILLLGYGGGYLTNKAVTISGNYISGLGTGDEGKQRRAIFLGRCAGVVIDGNSFKGDPWVSGGDIEQNIHIEGDITNIALRNNVAISVKGDDGTAIKSNHKLPLGLTSSNGCNFIDDIEVNQETVKNFDVRASKFIQCSKSSIAGGKLDVNKGNVYVLADGSEVSNIALTADTYCCQEVMFVADGSVTIKMTSTIMLNGGVDFVMGVGDTITLARVWVNSGLRWVEKSRSVNRAITE